MEELILRYRIRIFGFLKKYVKVTDVAEDLTQDILIKLWINRGKLELIDDQDSYVLAIVRNHIRDHFKKMIREQSYLDKVIEHMPRHDDSIYRTIQGNQLRESIHNVVKQLPERQKEVYNMVYLQGKSHKEIAKQLEISPYTVKNHCVQALKVIKSKVNPELFLSWLFTFSTYLGAI